jgi:hypothetical protein
MECTLPDGGLTAHFIINMLGLKESVPNVLVSFRSMSVVTCYCDMACFEM